MSRQGALPYQLIEELSALGRISGAEPSSIKPSSLDLTLSDEAYEVSGIFQPFADETVRQIVMSVKKKKISLASVQLVTGKNYIVRLNESLNLTQSLYASCNPKSTSGRIDTHVRLLADGVSRYDTVPRGYKGELWIAISPKTFNIRLLPGISLNQLRFFTEDTRLSPLELELALEKDKLLWHPDTGYFKPKDVLHNDYDGSAILRLDLSSSPAGYIGKHVETAIDTSKSGALDSKRFFSPIRVPKGRANAQLVLKRGEFYILSTYERVRVPPHMACEMAPMDERSGEFRSHYAGFIDPGWGWGKNGEGKGRTLTLEVRPFEDVVVRHLQPIGKIRFERMIDVPQIVYDAAGSNYVEQQGPRLAKYFK